MAAKKISRASAANDNPRTIPDHPKIYLCYALEDMNRGDSHGYLGLAQAIARKTNGELHRLDIPLLADLYPALSYREACDAYVTDHGTPDIVMSREWFRLPDSMRKTSIFSISNVNEELSSRHARETRLVSHNITPERLAQEGAEFIRHHPGIDHPLVAVMMVHDEESSSVARDLVALCDKFNRATFYVCSSPRTRENEFYAFQRRILREMADRDRSCDFKIRGYFLNGEKVDGNPYNPYVGLLDQADHIVVVGPSQSLVSEALASGKSVHIYNQVEKYNALQNKGLVHEFNRNALNHQFQTASVEPLNLTEQIADGIIRDYYDHVLNFGPWRKLCRTIAQKAGFC